jgi:hypothetical protein
VLRGGLGGGVRPAGARDDGDVRAGGGRARVYWALLLGAPAGWLSDRLPLDEVSDDALAVLEDDQGDAGAGFEDGARAGGVPPVPPESFDPAALGEPPAPPRPLRRLLVTGDSLSMPLDAELTRRLAGQGVEVERDPHVGTVW